MARHSAPITSVSAVTGANDPAPSTAAAMPASLGNSVKAPAPAEYPEARIGFVVVARVVLEDDRNAEPLPLGQRLDGVGELGHLPRRHGDTPESRRAAGATGLARIALGLHDVPQDERFIFCVSTNAVADGVTAPPQPAFIVSISISPAFSSSVNRATRSRTRASTGSRQSS